VNTMPRRAPNDIKSMARSYTHKAIKVLAGVLGNEQVPISSRIEAAKYLIDRGWGRAAQTIDMTAEITSKVIRAPELSDTNEEWLDRHVPQHLRSNGNATH